MNNDKHSSVQYVNASTLGLLQNEVNTLLHDAATQLGKQGRIEGSPTSVSIEGEASLVQAVVFDV